MNINYSKLLMATLVGVVAVYYPFTIRVLTNMMVEVLPKEYEVAEIAPRIDII